MLFSPSAYMNYKRLADAYKNQTLERYGNDSNAILGLSLTLFLVLIVIDILFVIAAIYFAFKCAAVGKIPMWLAVVLTILFFIPWVGGIAALVIIIYGLIACRKNKR